MPNAPSLKCSWWWAAASRCWRCCWGDSSDSSASSSLRLLGGSASGGGRNACSFQINERSLNDRMLLGSRWALPWQAGGSDRGNSTPRK